MTIAVDWDIKNQTNKQNKSNSLDPDQDQHFVGPGLGPNCLQRVSAGNDLQFKELNYRNAK